MTEAAELLMDVVSGLDLALARSRVSRAAGDEKFRTNGKTRTARRIDRGTFNTWRFEQRAIDLAKDDANL